MPEFASKHLPMDRDAVAPDGSDVRILLGLTKGGMTHFELKPETVSKAITLRTVEEIRYILSGRGKMWRKQKDRTEIIDLYSGVCLTIPQGTHFQFRSLGVEPLLAIGVTMPPWPGADEAILVTGPWVPTVSGEAGGGSPAGAVG